MGHMNSVVVILVTVAALGHCSRVTVNRWNYAMFKRKQKQIKQTKQQQQQQQNKEQILYIYLMKGSFYFTTSCHASSVKNQHTKDVKHYPFIASKFS